jgi:hypothetical protein
MFRKKLPAWFWVAIETPISGGGVPDHYWCHNGRDGWNEYKVTSGYSIRFRPEQVGWHARLKRAGGRSFIIVRRLNKQTDELWIYKGASAEMLALHGMSKVTCVDKQSGGPAQWDWIAIGATLLGYG